MQDEQFSGQGLIHPSVCLRVSCYKLKGIRNSGKKRFFPNCACDIDTSSLGETSAWMLSLLDLSDATALETIRAGCKILAQVLWNRIPRTSEAQYQQNHYSEQTVLVNAKLNRDVRSTHVLRSTMQLFRLATGIKWTLKETKKSRNLMKTWW